MIVKFEAKFAKDLRAVKNSKHLDKIKEIINACKAAHDLSELNQIKKLQGYDSFYRIRLGEYRIGIEAVNGEIIFTRFLHRKDIYKYFPR
ncbi:MAG: type II toxin-antitoxin system RelE family toxin [Methylococcaceae bacterium]